MLKKLLSKPKKSPSTILTVEKLNETLESLEKREQVLQKKISEEVGKALDYRKSNNRKGAIQCLKRKKFYESKVEQLGNFHQLVHDQLIMFEGANATIETVNALRAGASTVNSIQLSLDVDVIDMTMEDVTEATEQMKHIQESLAAPVGMTADIDEDELEAELEELEEAELDVQLPQPTEKEKATGSNLPDSKEAATAAHMEELTARQTQMALT